MKAYCMKCKAEHTIIGARESPINNSTVENHIEGSCNNCKGVMKRILLLKLGNKDQPKDI